MILNRLQTIVLLVLLLVTAKGYGQNCVSVTCPSNIVQLADTGVCSAIVTYAAPNDTNTCTILPVTTTINYTGSLASFTVPPGVTSLYIDGSGAQGGSVTVTCAATGGLGARMQGDFAVTPGEVLSIMVGQQGFTNGSDAGGGGGTFVVRAGNVCLLAAGGGGGASNNITQCGNNRNGVDASITTSGTASGNGVVAGGVNGNGGGASGGSGGGGGGFLTNGIAGTGLANNNGKSYLNGGIGGTGNNVDGGGYGGGGAGWFTGGNGGGGGGYSGGATSGNQPFTGGGGGGSINIGTNQVNTAGFQTGNGRVLITYGGVGPVTTTMIQGLASGSSFPVGTTTMTFAATDGAGSNDSCSFTVTVQDQTPPTIVCSGNIVASNDPGTCSTVVTYTPTAATDVCAGVLVSLIAGDTSGASFPVGVNTVTYQALDIYGNASSCSFTVTVTADDSSTQAFTICDGASVTVGNNTYTTTGTYSDVLTNGGGCDSVVTTVLNVLPSINTSTTVNGGTITASANAATYQWIDCGTGAPIQGATSQSYTPSVSGSFGVIVSDGNCSDTSACTGVVGLVNGLTTRIALFPNPTNGRIHVDFGSVLDQVQLEVYDVAGKRLLLQNETGSATATVDLSRFQNGVYLLKMTSATGQETLRIVKQD